MALNYRKKYICECCEKEYINFISVKRCCNSKSVYEKKHKNSDRSFKFRLRGTNKPESLKKAFALLGTNRECIVGYYRHRIDETNKDKLRFIINLSNEYIKRKNKPAELYDYDFYIELFSEKKI